MVRLSVDEIISTIKHSGLSTVFVEGVDDMFVFNRIEQQLGTLKASFLACGDKSTLLEVFKRRGELSNVPVCFVTDQDMWLFSGTPEGFADLILTSGYSIENDLYSDADIEKILDGDEKRDHAILIAEVCRWFAFEVAKCKKGQEFRTDPNLNRLVPLPGLKCCPIYLSTLGFTEPPEELQKMILREYKLSLRGKLLYEIIVRFTHAPVRAPRKYSYQSLMEMSVAYGVNGPLISKVIAAIRKKLNLPSEPQLRLPV